MATLEEINTRAKDAANDILKIYKKNTAGFSDQEKETFFAICHFKFMELLSGWKESIDIGQ